MKQLLVVLSLTLALVFASVMSNVHADTTLATVGDIGCKTNSIKNLQNIDKSGLPLLGLGDYRYSCSTSSIQTYYTAIEVKKGVKGNHELDSSTSSNFGKKNFGYGDRGYGSWKLGDIGIIILDPYKSYKTGSEQYNYVKAKSEQFAFKIVNGTKVPRTDINWIVYAVHEPLWTPNVGGGHSANSGLRSAYGPIIDQYNGFLLEAHNHATWMGTVAGVPQAGCGGGGYGGDTIGSLNGFDYGTTSTFGYCKIEFQKDKAIVQLIGTDGNIKHTHTFTKG